MSRGGDDANWQVAEKAGILDLSEQAGSGDEALQILMRQLLIDKSEPGEQSERLYTALAGIKQFVIEDFLRELPTTSIEDLRDAADKAGYDLEIIG